MFFSFGRDGRAETHGLASGRRDRGRQKGDLRPDDPRLRLRNLIARAANARLGGANREPDVYVTSTLPVQGQTVAVFVSIGKPRTPVGWVQRSLRTSFAHDDLVSVNFGGRSVPSYPLDRSKTKRDYPIYRALIPTTPADSPGDRVLEVRVLDGSYRPVKIPCTIQRQVFETQHIWLGKQKARLLRLRQTKREDAKVRAWQFLETGEQMWDGPFSAPSDGVITTQYGQRRFYNGKFAQNYFHKGLDYGADKGSPVSSPAAGRVVLVGREADGFDLHGNCVGLDHGQGVASMFMHLDEVKVKVDARVEKGQRLGTVGDTGIATGPHLHWGLFVHGCCVDPYMWMNSSSAHRLIF